MHHLKPSLFLIGIALLFSPVSWSATTEVIESLRMEIETIQRVYERRTAALEAKLTELEQAAAEAAQSKQVATLGTGDQRRIFDNGFNPSIGIILNGKFSVFSQQESAFSGFGIGEEGERGREGLAIDESELNFSANVDDKFYGSLTAAIVREEGEDKVELEEAYIQTMPGLGLPRGLSIKAGRAFWRLGYLNEHHSHVDDFVDRPLPYRVLLNNSFNDDGLEISYVLPSSLYAEIGGGIFRGDDFPFGGSTAQGPDAWSVFARIGNDIGSRQNWRLGGYLLSGEAQGEGRSSNEDELVFIGDSDLYIVDLRYIWAPSGNAREQELILQGEYFWRDEAGVYEGDAVTGSIDFDDSSSGWYVQAVYKWTPRWRIGGRYSQMHAPDVPAGLVGSVLDAGGNEPKAYAAMVDWSNSEFSRIRLQYNHETLSDGQDDQQIMLQYIMSLGAHGAHRY